VVERCKEEGSADGVYLYHVADMSDPNSATDLIQVPGLEFKKMRESGDGSYPNKIQNMHVAYSYVIFSFVGMWACH